MKKKNFILLLFIMILCLSSCDNLVTRNFGGTTEITLESGKKAVECTWKDNDIWILTEPMDSDYAPKTKEFIEYSLYGVLNGKVIIKETR